MDPLDVAPSPSRTSKRRRPDPDAVWDCRSQHSRPSQQLARARWCWIPGAAATDDRLKLTHWRFLAYLGRQNAEYGWLRISQTSLADEWGCSRQYLNGSIRQLVRWGYVEQTTQRESGETYCCYRVSANAPIGVSSTDDTPDVSDTDDTCVTSSGHGCSTSDDTPTPHTLYYTVNPMNQTVTPPSGESAQARARAPDVETDRVIDLEEVQVEAPPTPPPRNGSRQRPKKARAVHEQPDLLGENHAPRADDREIRFSPDWVCDATIIGLGASCGLTEERTRHSFDRCQDYFVSGKGKREKRTPRQWCKRIGLWFRDDANGTYGGGARSNGRVSASEQAEANVRAMWGA